MKSNFMIQQQRIIDAAIRLFRRRGYRAVTLSDIATEVGVSQPALYYYFKSKAGILKDIFDLSYPPFQSQVGSTYSLQIPPGEKMQRLIYEWVKYVALNADMVYVIVNERRELPPKDLRRVTERERAIVTQFRQLYEEGVQSGEFVNGHYVVAVRVLVGAIIDIATWYKVGGAISPDELANFVSGLLANGYLKKRLKK